jgi:hypothetical protein
MTPTEAREMADEIEKEGHWYKADALRSLADQVEALQKSESAIRASERERNIQSLYRVPMDDDLRRQCAGQIMENADRELGDD